MTETLVKRVSLSTLAHKINEVRRLINMGYKVIVFNSKENKEEFVISSANEQAIPNENSSEYIEIGYDEDCFVPLTEEEKKMDLYELFKKDPNELNCKPIARFATDR